MSRVITKKWCYINTPITFNWVWQSSSLQVPMFKADEWFICSAKVTLLLNEIEEVACRWFSSSVNTKIKQLRYFIYLNQQFFLYRKPILNFHFKSFNDINLSSWKKMFLSIFIRQIHTCIKDIINWLIDIFFLNIVEV